MTGFHGSADIDLGAINYTTGDAQLSFVEDSAHTSGVLTIKDATLMAALSFIGLVGQAPIRKPRRPLVSSSFMFALICSSL